MKYLIPLLAFFCFSSLSAQCLQGDCQNGRGTLLLSNGAVYTGQFQQQLPHGTGVCDYPDGSRYSGQWTNGQQHGQGTIIYPNGTARTGRWVKGSPISSEGQLISNYQAKREAQQAVTTTPQTGCLAGDCQNGRGIMVYLDGSRYEGDFRFGQPDGKGIFYYPNGDRYNGAFQSGFPHGEGTLHKKDGTHQQGNWREGNYMGNHQQLSKGCVSGDCQNGNGTYIFQAGDRYVGTFQNGLPHGKGTVSYTNGERYEGEMARAKFNGYGTLFLADGTAVSGFWKDGVFLRAGAQASTPSRPSGPQLNVWAVVIGVAAYHHMPALRYTDDDAYRMYAFLKSPEGGALDDDHIRILVDEEATLSNIRQTMSTLFGQAGPNDLVLLYFSGHGLHGSFLPFDFDGSRNKLLHEEVSSLLSRSPAKYKLCIADACHSGSLLAMRGGAPQQMLADYYRELSRASAGTALLMSSKSDETSLESSGLRQGVFSHYLIRGLKGEADRDGDGLVSVQELYIFVDRNVRSYTGNMQSPLLQGSYDPKMPVSVRRK